MKIKVVCVGTIKEPFYKDAIAEYSKRMQKYCKLEIVEVKQGKSDNENAKKEEYDLLFNQLEGYIVALCIEGKMMNSEQLANKFNELGVIGNSTITFVIGGSFGLDEKIKEYADLKLSFSKLTFPHQLFRVMLLEQIYRAFTIINNTPYHK